MDVHYSNMARISMYGSTSKRFEVKVKQWNFKRLTLKVKVKEICDVAEVRP